MSKVEIPRLSQNMRWALGHPRFTLLTGNHQLDPSPRHTRASLPPSSQDNSSGDLSLPYQRLSTTQSCLVRILASLLTVSQARQEQRLCGTRTCLIYCCAQNLRHRRKTDVGGADGAQRGVHKQQRLSTNSNAPASAPCPAEVAAGAGRSGGCLRTWGVQREDGLAWPQQPGPWGPCSEEQTHKSSTESPFPPRLLPLRGSGWGTPIVLLSGHEQTKKRLPGAAGCSLSPSSVSWSSDWRRHPHSLSLPCSLEATWGFGQA